MWLMDLRESPEQSDDGFQRVQGTSRVPVQKERHTLAPDPQIAEREKLADC
jgi:hypothetical protein